MNDNTSEYTEYLKKWLQENPTAVIYELENPMENNPNKP